MKKSKKNARAADMVPMIFPRASWWVIVPVFMVWTVIVLQNYFKLYPLNGFGLFLTGYEQYDPMAILRRAGESMLHVGKVLALCVAAVGIGGMVIGRFFNDDEPRRDRLFFEYAVGLGIFSLSFFLMGIAGFLSPVLWGTVIIICCINGIYILSAPGLISFTFRSFSGWEKTSIIVIGCIALFNFIGACCPELFYDAQYYQVGIPLKWLLDHRIATTEYTVASFFPFNINLLFMIAHMFGNDITAKMVSFVCGISVCWGIYQFGKRFFTREVGVVAALIFYCVPQVMIGSWKAAVELGIAVFDFGTVFALMYYIVKKERGWLVLAGVLCGLSMGSKYTGLVFCFIPAVMTLAIAGVWRRQSIYALCRDIALFSLIAVAVCSPWYIRNYIASGNPVFPFFWGKIGFLKLKMTQSLFSDPPPPPFSFYNYFCFLWPSTMGTLQQESFLGPVFLVFIPYILVFKRIDFKIKILGVYMLFSVLFWAVLGRFYMRYLIPTLPVISIVFAYYIAGHASKAIKKISFLLLLGIALFNAVSASWLMQNMYAPLSYFLGMESRNEYLSVQREGYPDPSYPVLDYANKHLDKNAVILFLGETRGLFSNKRFIVSGVAERSPLADWLKESSDADHLFARLRGNGVTHILLNVREAMRLKGYDLFDWDGREMRILDEFWKQHVREIYHDIADVSAPQKGIRSLKNDDPRSWQQYAANPYNYVFLYEIVPSTPVAGGMVPYNFFVDEALYSSDRWGIMTAGADGKWLLKNERETHKP
ncbi:MAG: glycosyltransferase family 39 protein [Elusimicrobia bacterium]|nr:glycosyltransferase family 39 protein [Elusimicrobiota bacterium]